MNLSPMLLMMSTVYLWAISIITRKNIEYDRQFSPGRYRVKRTFKPWQQGKENKNFLKLPY